MMKRGVVTLLLLSISGLGQAAEILITKFDFTGYAAMEANLEADGHMVDVVDVTTGGTLATTLGAKAYDQVFLFDLTSVLYLNAADTAALGTFWTSHPGLVVDTRSYGYTFQPNQASEIALLQNVASTFDSIGGGVWVGSDHAPTWTRNANAFLSEIGIDTITGSHSDAVNFADLSSVLLTGVTPAQLWGGGQSVGEAPIGIQPNFIEMFIHFGHEFTDGSKLPYISASFPLEGPDPVPVPEAGLLSLIGFGLLAIGLSRRFDHSRCRRNA